MQTEIINESFYFHFPYIFTSVELLLSFLFSPVFGGAYYYKLLEDLGVRMALLCRSLDCAWKCSF